MNYITEMVIINPSDPGIANVVLHDQAVQCMYASRACVGRDAGNANVYEYLSARIRQGHWSVLEHGSFQVEFRTSISIARELARHRLCAISQESTRYVTYKDVADHMITNVLTEYDRACLKAYNQAIKLGEPPEIARDLLPLGWPTRIIVTANFREWAHIYKVRSAPAAHPHMRQLMDLFADALYEVNPNMHGLITMRSETE